MTPGSEIPSQHSPGLHENPSPCAIVLKLVFDIISEESQV